MLDLHPDQENEHEADGGTVGRDVLIETGNTQRFERDPLDIADL
jgi:hypothetical protein